MPAFEPRETALLRNTSPDCLTMRANSKAIDFLTKIFCRHAFKTIRVTGELSRLATFTVIAHLINFKNIYIFS